MTKPSDWLSEDAPCWVCAVVDGGALHTAGSARRPGLGHGVADRARRQARLRADGITLRQHNDVAGGQEVFHFHLHVVPRFTGDAERFAAPPQLISFEEQEHVAERLRSALAHD